MQKVKNEYYYADIERLICLAALLCMSYFLYGFRPLVLVALSLFVAGVCDRFMIYARPEHYNQSDLSSYVFAATLTLMLPASIDYTVVITSTVIAVLIGKHAFGGMHHYPFNPAAVGYTVAVASWPDKIFKYPMPFAELPLYGGAPVLYDSPANALKRGGLPNISVLNSFIGNYAGPLGTTFTVVILAAAVLLLARKRISPIILFTFLISCSLVIILFPRVSDVSVFHMLRYELSSGALFFGAVFIVTDDVVLPSKLGAQVIYAAVLGVLTMMFRYYGAFELGICFAVIIISALSGFFDRITTGVQRQRKRRVTGGK